MRFIPVILTDNANDLKSKISILEGLTDYAQVDFMDAVFTPVTSVSPAEVAKVRTSLMLEAHLMVQDPLAHIRQLAGTSFVRAFFHFEAVPDPRLVIHQIRDLGMKVGLAVNPGTRTEEFRSLVRELDAVLFLGVNPGYRHAEFQYPVLAELKRFKAAYPNVEAGIDGGVRLGNLDEVIARGPDFICAGDAVFGASEPAAAFRELKERIELKGYARGA